MPLAAHSLAPSPFARAVTTLVLAQQGRSGVVLVREPGRATWSACSELELGATSDTPPVRAWLGFDAQNFPAVETPMAVVLGPKNTALASLLPSAKQQLLKGLRGLEGAGPTGNPFGRPVCAFVDSLDWLGRDLGHPAGARGLEVQWNPAGTSLALRATRWLLEVESEPAAGTRLRISRTVGATTAAQWRTLPPEQLAHALPLQLELP